MQPKTNVNRTIFVGTALIPIFILSFLLYAPQSRGAQRSATAAPEENDQHPNEALFIAFARDYIGIGAGSADFQRRAGEIAIEEEKTYYVRAGYWSQTSRLPEYLADPDRLIFVYSVRGQLGYPRASFGGAGALPRKSPPEPKILTALTLAVDTHSPQSVLVFDERFIDNIEAEMFDAEARAEFISAPVQYEESQFLDEAALLEVARLYADTDADVRRFPDETLRIEEETTFFVAAGDWRSTAGLRPFQNNPSYPLFVYTAKGQLGLLHNGEGMGPVYPPRASVTIVLDALNGYLVTDFQNLYAADLAADRLVTATP